MNGGSRTCGSSKRRRQDDGERNQRGAAHCSFCELVRRRDCFSSQRSADFEALCSTVLRAHIDRSYLAGRTSGASRAPRAPLWRRSWSRVRGCARLSLDCRTFVNRDARSSLTRSQQPSSPPRPRCSSVSVRAYACASSRWTRSHTCTSNRAAGTKRTSSEAEVAGRVCIWIQIQA